MGGFLSTTLALKIKVVDVEDEVWVESNYYVATWRAESIKL